MLWTVFTSSLLLVVSGQARPGDPLVEARARRQVVIDRVDRMVLEAVQLARRDPLAGGPALENARQVVRQELALPEDRRLAHLKLIQAVEDRMAPSRAPGLWAPRILPPGVTNPAATRILPAGTPAAVAGGMIATNRDSIASQADARQGAAIARQGELRRVEANAALPDRDIAFPADWAEKSSRRTGEGKNSPQQKRIIAGLNKPVTASMDSVDLKGFFDWFEKQTGVDVQVDRNALE
ncbi:MAG: hypothetical protein ACKOS8_20605, partial [Gemmataceae bacterium]